MDAVYHLQTAEHNDISELRRDLLVLPHQTPSPLRPGPAGEPLRYLLGGARPYTKHAVEIRSHSPGMGRRMMAEIIGRTVARGVIDPEAAVSTQLEVCQALLRNHFRFWLEPIPDNLVVEVVDTVLSYCSTRARTSGLCPGARAFHLRKCPINHPGFRLRARLKGPNINCPCCAASQSDRL
ncbi:TetR-like C-terminal domain-containing protein [Nocardiopsis prasina]|uniref:TetR-like C-terminal domain-containing protein n=1 Tax=Nocardiopsis prasina TaxID=2015 RepID=UPI001EF9F900|nr:TetR-like C-terminal domain-containing protein [Nocardiopsis prasina]